MNDGESTIKSENSGAVWSAGALRTNQLASLLGVTPPAVTAMAARGCPRNGDGTYGLAAVVQWLRTGGLDLSRVRQSDILEILNTTKPTLKTWEENGLPRNTDGTYDVAAAVRWRLAELGDKLVDARQMSELEEARTRKVRADAQRAELDLAHRSGELLNRKTVLAGWIARYHTFKAALVGMISKLPGENFSGEQVQFIRGEVLRIMQYLTDGHAKLELRPAEVRAWHEMIEKDVAETFAPTNTEDKKSQTASNPTAAPADNPPEAEAVQPAAKPPAEKPRKRPRRAKKK